MSNLSFFSPDLDRYLPTITTNLSFIQSPDNLKLKQPAMNWVSVSGSSVNITVQIGAVLQFDTVWLGYTNLSNSATYRIRTANTSANLTASPAYDSGTLSFKTEGWERPHLLHSAPTINNSWVMITLTDSTIGHFEAGRLYLSKRFTLPKNISYNWGVNYLHGVKEKEAESGIDIVHETWRNKRQFTFTVEMTNKLEMFQLIEPIIRKHGNSKDVLVVVDKDETSVLQSLMVYGRFSDNFPIVNEEFNIFSRQFEVTEFI